MATGSPGPAAPPRTEVDEADGARLDADAVVVGSGFGGAVAACRLAQAGLKVLVLERGRRYEADDFPALPDEGTLLPDLRRWTWQRDQGLWDVVDLEEIVAVQAAGYGGGSLVYASVHLRPPGLVFDDKWPAVYRGGGELEDYYDLAAHMLEVAPVSAHPAFAGSLVKLDQMEQAAAQLGRRTFHPSLAIRYEDGTNVHHARRNACKRCGDCCAGCRHGAKNTLDVTYLATAERRGARALTQCEVTGLRDLGQGGWEVRYVDHLEAADRRLRAKYVFLCAGSVHSTRLLARAELREEGREARALAGVGYFPGADAFGIVYETRHEQYPSFGPTITTALADWDSARPHSFLLVEDGGYGRQLERIMGLFRARAWAGRNRLTRAGEGKVQRSENAPPSQIPPLEAGTGSGEPPPLDALLDALSAGDFRDVIGKGARRSFSALASELEGALLLSAVIDSTLNRALHERLRLRPGGWLSRAIKCLAYLATGGPTALAHHALGAVLSGGDLDRTEIAKRVLGISSDEAQRRAMFLCMGRDAARGQLFYDAGRDRLVADLELFDLAPGYAGEELLMKGLARALGGELRTNPAWAFLGKPITVHNQGGCRMSDRPEHGVTSPDGQVWGCHGLYVLDGATLCASVGANPSATILALAERNVLAFIRKLRPSWPEGDGSAGAEEYRAHREGASRWAERARREGWDVAVPLPVPAFQATLGRPLGLVFHETMQGYYAPAGAVPGRGVPREGSRRSALLDDDRYREHETAGCPEFPVRLKLRVWADDLAAFFEDERHQMRVRGRITLRLPDAPPGQEETRRVEGWLRLMVPRSKPHAIRDEARRRAQEFATGRRYTAKGGRPEPQERFMRYALFFADAAGRRWRLAGYKRIRPRAGIDAWRATSSLFCRLGGGLDAGAGPRRPLGGAGVVHVELTSFLRRQLPSMRVVPRDEDPARKAWAMARFAAFFFGNLQRIYLPELGAFLGTLIRAQLGDIRHHPW